MKYFLYVLLFGSLAGLAAWDINNKTTQSRDLRESCKGVMLTDHFGKPVCLKLEVLQ